MRHFGMCVSLVAIASLPMFVQTSIVNAEDEPATVTPPAQQEVPNKLDSGLDKSRLTDCELHVVGIYRAMNDTTDDRVYVEVQKTEKPVVVVVCSYMEVQWHLKIAADADVRQIIVGGYFEQDLADPPANIPVAFRTYFSSSDENRDKVSRNYFYAYSWNTSEGRDVRKKLKDLTGLEIKTFQGQSDGSRFVIDGKRGETSSLETAGPASTGSSSKSQGGLNVLVEGLAEMAKATYGQILAARAEGHQKDVEKYSDALSYILLSIRIQQDEIASRIKELQSRTPEDKALSADTDKEIRELQELLSLPEQYKEFLPASEPNASSRRLNSPQPDVSGIERMSLDTARQALETAGREAEKAAQEAAAAYRTEAVKVAPDVTRLQSLRAQLENAVREALQKQNSLQEIRLQLAAHDTWNLQNKHRNRVALSDKIIARRIEHLISGSDLSRIQDVPGVSPKPGKTSPWLRAIGTPIPAAAQPWSEGSPIRLAIAPEVFQRHAPCRASVAWRPSTFYVK